MRTRLWGPSGDLTLTLALDTGASYTVIDHSRLMYVGYDPAAAGPRTQIVSASAIEFVPKVRISQLAALGLVRTDMDVLAHTLPSAIGIDGLLGLDFLRDHILTIDFTTGLIDLT